MVATSKTTLTGVTAIATCLGIVTVTAKLGKGIPFWLGIALLETAILALIVPLFASTRSTVLGALQLFVGLCAQFILAASFVPPQCYGNAVDASLVMLLVFPALAIQRASWMAFAFAIAPIMAHISRGRGSIIRVMIATAVLVVAAAATYLLLLNVVRPGDSCAIS